MKGTLGPETKDLGLALALPPISEVPFIPNTECSPCQELGWARRVSPWCHPCSNEKGLSPWPPPKQQVQKCFRGPTEIAQLGPLAM